MVAFTIVKWKDVDLSRWFVDEVGKKMKPYLYEPSCEAASWNQNHCNALREICQGFTSSLMREFGLNDINRVKQGIGESTRSLLRRVPDVLLLKDRESIDVRHLVWLAEKRDVPVILRPDMPYNASVIIKSLGK